MRIELDEYLINEAVRSLAEALENDGQADGLPEGQVSLAVEAGIREHIIKLATFELIGLSTGEKVHYDDLEPILLRRLAEARKKKTAVSVA